MSGEGRVSELCAYGKQIAYTKLMGFKEVTVRKVSAMGGKLSSFVEKDQDFLKVLAVTVLAIGGLIVMKRLWGHLTPVDKPVVPLKSAVPVESGFGLQDNGAWGWHA